MVGSPPNRYRPPRHKTLQWQISGAEGAIRDLLRQIARRGERGATPQQKAKLATMQADLRGMRNELDCHGLQDGAEPESRPQE
jgi:hypothetical protein